MTFKAAAILIIAGLLTGCHAASLPQAGGRPAPEAAIAAAGEIVIPSSTNAVRLRLYTDASPDAAHLFNTIQLEAFGEVLLPSPGGPALQRWLAAPSTNASLHSVLLNGTGPQLAASNSMTILEHADGPGWSYVALDASRAYPGLVKEYRRGLLFVEPDLIILWDHLVARESVSFEMLVHPPPAARVDPIWRDLRLELPKAGVRIHAPAPRKQVRDWRPISTVTNSLPAGTTTMRVGPTNRLAGVDLLTVFAVHPGGETRDVAFRLLEGKEAVGARIHRQGHPTLVAFKTDAAAPGASLTGFEFTGPVGVSVFKPKKLPVSRTNP